MAKVTLFRAAEREGAHFGFNSYWATTIEYALRKMENDLHSVTFPRENLAIFTVEVDIPSDGVDDRRSGPAMNHVAFDNQIEAGTLAVEGSKWIIANVIDSDRAVVEMAVYLGDGKLQPTFLVKV